MGSPNAITSLYGGSVARKRKSSGELNSDATALAGCIGGQARTQEVHTPTWVLECVERTFSGRIAYDPCAASDPAHWFADRNDTLPPETFPLIVELAECDDKARRRDLKRLLKPYYLALPAELEDRTFLNPAFDFLAPWMELVLNSAADGKRSILLCPVRPHRTWWTRCAAGANGVWLAPFPFVGQTQSFPAPVCLLARNCDLPPMGKRETGRFRL